MQNKNEVCFKVYGKYGLFSDPLTRVGGEKSSYQIPTYEALKGIVGSIYWKPTFLWVIDSCRVMNVIQMESKGIRTLKNNHDDENDLSIYTYLSNVEYQVKAHFIWNEHRPELQQDRNENKHWLIAKRMIERGGRRDVFLGTRECQAYVEPCVFGEGESFYDKIESLAFGNMFHGFNYPDETGKGILESRFWTPIMHHGIIDFPTPEECTIVRPLKKAEMRKFEVGKNIQLIEKDGVCLELDAEFM